LPPLGGSCKLGPRQRPHATALAAHFFNGAASATPQPLRAAHLLKPPALPEDTYSTPLDGECKRLRLPRLCEHRAGAVAAKRVLPQARYLAGFWMLGEDSAKAEDWKVAVGADFVATSLDQAAQICAREMRDAFDVNIPIFRKVIS
jgi:hypothetical protein